MSVDFAMVFMNAHGLENMNFQIAIRLGNAFGMTFHVSYNLFYVVMSLLQSG